MSPDKENRSPWDDFKTVGAEQPKKKTPLTAWLALCAMTTVVGVVLAVLIAFALGSGTRQEIRSGNEPRYSRQEFYELTSKAALLGGAVGLVSGVAIVFKEKSKGN